MTAARLKWYGWGREGEGMTPPERDFVLGRYREKFAVADFVQAPVPALEDVNLPASRLTPPAPLAAFCSSERYDRAAHAYGKSYPDYVRAMLGDFTVAPDVVAFPRDEAEVAAVMEWAGEVGASLAPFGGGARSRWTCATSAACLRWTRPRARRGSRAAPSARRSRRN